MRKSVLKFAKIWIVTLKVVSVCNVKMGIGEFIAIIIALWNVRVRFAKKIMGNAVKDALIILGEINVKLDVLRGVKMVFVIKRHWNVILVKKTNGEMIVQIFALHNVLINNVTSMTEYV